MEAYKYCPVNEAYLFTSPLMNIDIFKEQCVLNIDFEDLEVRRNDKSQWQIDNEKLADKLKTDLQTVLELEEVCSIENLKCDYEDQFDFNQRHVFKDFPDDNKLQTVKQVKMGKTKVEELAYVPTFPEPVMEEISEEDELVPSGEVLLTVSIFHPEKRRVHMEFKVLPDQKLTEVRDLITCQSDKVIFGEFSSNPSLEGIKTAKEISDASFFFIEQSFYNDTRNPLNRDYSRIIKEWAKESERYTVPGLGLFDSTNMQDKTFRDLNFRLGYPYLFCHQGNCEHLMVFNDMRLISEDDPQKVESYPLKTLVLLPRHKRCSICNIHLIKWMTKNDEMAFEDPSFFCDKCFRYLHYTKDGKKLASFQAYPYVSAD